MIKTLNPSALWEMIHMYNTATSRLPFRNQCRTLIFCMWFWATDSNDFLIIQHRLKESQDLFLKWTNGHLLKPLNCCYSAATCVITSSTSHPKLNLGVLYKMVQLMVKGLSVLAVRSYPATFPTFSISQ